MGGFSAAAPAFLDVAVSSRLAAADARLAHLDAALSSRLTPAGQNVSAAEAADLDADVSSRLAGIRSIQRGSITFSTVFSVAATITSVNTAKAKCHNNGVFYSADPPYLSRIELTNATTVTNEGFTQGSGYPQTAYFVVVERN